MSTGTPTAAKPPQSDSGEWLTAGRFTILLAAIIAARFAPVLLGRESFYYRDYGLYTFPIAHYFRDCFWRGELPLWNPYNDCGVPLLAQWNSSLLYPPSLFYLVLPLVWALGVFQLAHLVFAGLGMYLLARKWTGNSLAGGVAGMAFALNGLSLHMLMWISNLAAYAWMPWVVLAAAAGWRRGGRALVPAALAGALQMLSGAPELILLTWIFVAGVGAADLWREKNGRAKIIFRGAAIVGLTGVLAAVQLLPFLQLLAHSQRSAGYGDSRWAMPGWGWANFLVPLFHCSPSILGIFSQDAQQWTASYYLGAGILALAVWGILKRPAPDRAAIAGLAIAAFAGIILAMGDNAPFYGVVKKIFPQLAVMRYPIKLVVMTALALPLLAAYGVAAATVNDDARAKSRALFLPVGIGIVLVALIGGIIAWATLHPVEGESANVTLISGLTRAAFLVLILGTVGFIGTSRAVRTRQLASFALLLLVALDALTHAPTENPTIPAACYGPLDVEKNVTARLGETRAFVQPALQSFLSHAATSDAIGYYVTLRRNLFLNVNLIEQIPTVGGFFSLELGDYAAVEKLLYNGTDQWPQPLANFLGVAQISGADAGSAWKDRVGAMRWVTAGQTPRFAGREETLKALASPDFQPDKIVYLPREAESMVPVTNGTKTQIAGFNFTAQRIEFVATAENPALVVIAQAFYPSWAADVDGKRVKLWEANAAFQAVEIPAGRHHVKLVYEDAAFKKGAMISLAGAVALGLIFIFGRDKSEKTGVPE